MGERDLARPALRSWPSGGALASWLVLGAGLAAVGVLSARFEPPPAAAAAGKAAAAGFAESLDLLPFARLTPGRPAALLAGAALALAAVLGARAASRRLGGAAPLWIAAWIFGSVVWVAVLWSPAAVVALSASVIAFALAFGAEQPPLDQLPEVFEPPGGRGVFAVAARWLLVGGLLGLLAAIQPLYLPLLLPAALAAPLRRRSLAWGALGVGAAAVIAAGLAVGGVQPWLERLGKIELDRRLAGWNALYLLAGRNVGILLAFFPLLLLALAFRADRPRRWLLAMVVLIAALFVLLHPFDFYGGPGALGNRLFLPLYGALWLTAARPARGAPALLAMGLGAALLWPLARAPLAHPLLPGGGYRHASGWASRYLPFETSQRQLPVPEVHVDGARLRFLDERSWASGGSRGASLRILGGAESELLLASRAELGSLLLEFDRRASSRLEVGGGELGETILRPDGGVAFEVLLGEPRAVHPAWWSEEPHHFYLLELRLPGARPVPIAFSLAPQERPAWKPDG